LFDKKVNPLGACSATSWSAFSCPGIFPPELPPKNQAVRNYKFKLRARQAELNIDLYKILIFYINFFKVG